MAPALSSFPKRLALIAFLGLVIYLLGNGATSLWDRDEPRFAEAAREMVVTGDYVVPHFHGEVRFDKPPLIYWLMAGAYRLCGVGSFGARLPSAVAGALSLVLVALIGRRLIDAGAGLRAAVVLGLCMQFVVEAKVATTDAVLLCAILTAQLALLRSWQWEGGWGNTLLAWGAVALGILAKGPVAPMVVGVTAVALKLFGGRKWPWRPAPLAVGLGFALLLVVPWGVAVQLATDGEFLRVAFGHHVVERSTHALEGHKGPIWYYLTALPVSFFPWGFLGYGVLFELYRRRDQAAARFLATWFVPPFLIFSITATKLPHYVLPVYPALALGVAWLATGSERPRWWTPCVALNALLALAAAAVLVWGGNKHLPGGLPLAVLALAAGLTCVAIALARVRWRWQAAAVAVCTAVTLAWLGGAAMPALERFKPSPQMVAALATAAAPDRRYAFRYFEPSLVFHSGDTVTEIRERDDLDILLASPAPFACVLRRELWDEIGSHLPTIRVVREIDGYNVARGRWRQWVVVTNQQATPKGHP